MSADVFFAMQRELHRLRGLMDEAQSKIDELTTQISPLDTYLTKAKNGSINRQIAEYEQQILNLRKMMSVEMDKGLVQAAVLEE